jgi:hypothetical protein
MNVDAFDSSESHKTCSATVQTLNWVSGVKEGYLVKGKVFELRAVIFVDVGRICVSVDHLGTEFAFNCYIVDA